MHPEDSEGDPIDPPDPAAKRPMLLDGPEALSFYAGMIAANIRAMLEQTKALAGEIAIARKAMCENIPNNVPDKDTPLR